PGPGHPRIRALLVVVETSLGVVLLVAAGLLLRSFYRIAHTDPGFDPSRIVTARLSLPDARYPYLKQIAFYDSLVADLNALPGVRATAARPLPLSGSSYPISFEQPGLSLPMSQHPSADIAIVAPGYFRLMRTPIVAGRDFSAADTDAAPRVIIVNESFARRF